MEDAALTEQASSPPEPQATDLDRYGDDLRAALQPLEWEISAARAAFFSRLSQEHWEPLRARVRELAAIHAGLISQVDPDPEGVPLSEDLVAAARRIREYRTRALTRVLEPLGRALGDAALGAAVLEAWREMRRRWDGAARALPAEFDRLEPLALYRAAPTDDLWTRAHKGAVRFARWVRRVRPVDVHQVVPTRGFGEVHARVRLPQALGPLLEEMARELAAPLARLEAAVSAWGRDVPAAEGTVDSLEEHGSEELRTFLAGTVVRDEDAALMRRLVERVTERAQGLQVVLDQTAAAPSLEAFQERVETVAGLEWTRLLMEAGAAGTFMVPADRAEVDPDGETRAAVHGEQLGRWAPWHRQAQGRVDGVVAVVGFRGALTALEDDFLVSVWEEVVRPVVMGARSALAELEGLQDRAQLLLAADAQSDETILDGFATLLAEIQRVDRALDSTLEQADVVRRARELGDALPERLLERVRDLPKQVEVHDLPGADEEGPNPRARTRTMSFREIARQELDVLLLERFRVSVDPLIAGIGELREQCHQVWRIAEFNLESARAEIAGEGEKGDGNPRDAARTLTGEGLQRARDALDGTIRGLAPRFQAFARAEFAAFEDAWVRVHGRATGESAVQEQLLGLRARTVAHFARLEGQAGERIEGVASVLRQVGGGALRRVRTLVRMGRSAVGTIELDEADVERSLMALAGVDELLASLPLVYRRLLSFQSVTDPDFLIGREDELQWVSERLERWSQDTASPLVISARHGSGLSSFMNVLVTKGFGRLPAKRLRLQARIGDEAIIAALLAETLELPSAAGHSLASLVQHVLGLPSGNGPRVVCVVEQIEHLILRVLGGSNLLESVLSAMARTSGQVFWVTTMVETAWQYLDKTEPQTAKLAVRLSVSPLTREEIQVAILGRHRRSGLPLLFDEPSDPGPIMARRLRRASQQEERQAILRDDYFDRLARATDRNPMLSFFYWLRSAVFESEAGILRVRPFRPLSLAFLSALDLQQAFTLKALLEHTTLTLEEHDRIFSIPRAESYQIFQSLRSRLLVEAAPGAGPASDAGISDGVRYRIRPLLLQPVVGLLRERHVLH